MLFAGSFSATVHLPMRPFRADYQRVGAGRVADLGPGSQTVGFSSIAYDGLQLRENPRPTLLGVEQHAETPVRRKVSRVSTSS